MLRNLLSKIDKFIVPVTFLIGIAVRLYLTTLPAQYYDIATYEAWGKIMIAKGPYEFFPTTWTDYLPLPIYFCSFIVMMTEYIKADFGLVFKIVVSVIEMSLIAAIWKLVKSPGKKYLLPFLVLSPALIGDSSWWGQLDTIPSLLSVLTMVLITSEKRTRAKLMIAALSFGIAVAFKPIMVLAVPVLTILLLTGPKGIMNFLIFGAASFAVFMIPSIGSADNPLKFVIEKTIEQSNTYPYTTINGWNMWSVPALNNSWPPDNRSILGVTAQSFGHILFGIITVCLFFQWKKKKFDMRMAPRIAGVLLVAFYTFTTRMHERHLFFGLPFLALASLTDRSIRIPLAILTATFTLNLWAAYVWVNNMQTWPVSQTFIQIVSGINVLTALYLAAVQNVRETLGKIGTWVKDNKVLVVILVTASFLRLYQLGYPEAYIFDEVYHSFTARELIHNNIAAWEWWTTPPEGVAYEWTHPPFAKYGMVASMLLFGENSFGWRFGSAFMGVLCILGIYYLVREVLGKKIALTAAFLVAIEGLHISQSRVGMNDMYMLCFLVWSLYNAVKNKWKHAAVLFGLALSCKWSALYGVIPLGIIYLHGQTFHLSARNLLGHLVNIIRLLLITVLTYIIMFVPFLTAGHTWEQWWELHRQMWYYHTHLVATHAYQSTPYQWLFVLRPVWYYVNYGEKVSNIYAQGNPAVLWLGLAALLLLLTRIFKFRYLIFIVLYAVFTLPWVFSPRIMFFYHYLPSATFLCVLLAAWLAELPNGARIGVLIITALTLIVLSPVYFGFPMAKTYWDTLFGIFPSWK